MRLAQLDTRNCTAPTRIVKKKKNITSISDQNKYSYLFWAKTQGWSQFESTKQFIIKI